MDSKNYEQLSKLKTFRERFEYLKLSNVVGEDTFGANRYLNQDFYNSTEWRRVRNYVITRDLGCDLGVPGFEIVAGKAIVHHINPVTVDDIFNKSERLLDPNNLITTTDNTHNGIHYGVSYDDFNLRNREVVERTPDDTKLW